MKTELCPSDEKGHLRPADPDAPASPKTHTPLLTKGQKMLPGFINVKAADLKKTRLLFETVHKGLKICARGIFVRHLGRLQRTQTAIGQCLLKDLEAMLPGLCDKSEPLTPFFTLAEYLTARIGDRGFLNDLGQSSIHKHLAFAKRILYAATQGSRGHKRRKPQKTPAKSKHT